MSVSSVLVLVDLMIAASQRFAALSSIYSTMRAEGRTELNKAEWDAVLAADDSADARLAADIERAKSEGR